MVRGIARIVVLSEEHYSKLHIIMHHNFRF